MFTNKFQTKTAKLARSKNTGKFGCTDMSVFLLQPSESELLFFLLLALC